MPFFEMPAYLPPLYQKYHDDTMESLYNNNKAFKKMPLGNDFSCDEWNP